MSLLTRCNKCNSHRQGLVNVDSDEVIELELKK